MGATTLSPGNKTSVSLTMMMHPGMDGPHLFRIALPVEGIDGKRGEIELFVRADFG